MGKGQGTREWGARELGSWHRRGPSSHASRLQHSDLCGLRVSRNLLSTQIVTKTTRYSMHITHDRLKYPKPRRDSDVFTVRCTRGRPTRP